MALNHDILEIRDYYDTWIAIVNIIDTLSSSIYHFRWNFNEYPTEEILTPVIASAKLAIQLELLMQANPLNEDFGEMKIYEDLRGVKAYIVQTIRANPDITASAFLAASLEEYANSMVNIQNVYAHWLKEIKLLTWDEFKAFVISHKFREID